ncbi:ABC transporter permease [Halapricum desulfuricans]|uniref:ABC-type multidrug transport system, permease component n=1 Tax=Halapricum desulfuricans TaxID=2841257 RepID=A0A897NQB3_9EURY|nr:ABC transporter permease [Halapricum desulfuricans]QSG14997.1 ABC-type multidrug transport system, permease component [Halapricum desulfuricans]
MSRTGRLRASSRAAALSFLRRRTAVFFTFLFPLLIVLIFGALIETGAGGGGLFAEPPGYYVPGYLAVVVLFTPLSRVGSEVARHREGNRFEKLATTPLRRWEWLFAQTLVNVAVIGLAALLLLALLVVVTGAEITLSPLLIPFVVAGVALFCGIGALIGALADSQDGVIATSNAIALPLLFLSETFAPPSLLPAWFRPALELSPLTYFSRGVRAATFDSSGDPLANLAVLIGLAALALAVGALALPRVD